MRRQYDGTSCTDIAGGVANTVPRGLAMAEQVEMSNRSARADRGIGFGGGAR